MKGIPDAFGDEQGVLDGSMTIDELLSLCSLRGAEPKMIVVLTDNPRQGPVWNGFGLPGGRVEESPTNEPLPPQEIDLNTGKPKPRALKYVAPLDAIIFNPTCGNSGGVPWWFWP